MVDVVFLLIVFFMLVAQFTRQQAVELRPPDPSNPATVEQGDEARIVVNVSPGDDAYVLGGRRYPGGEDGEALLAEAVAAERARRPGAPVVVRADRSEAYAIVHGALRAVREAGATRVELATAPRGGGAS